MSQPVPYYDSTPVLIYAQGHELRLPASWRQRTTSDIRENLEGYLSAAASNTVKGLFRNLTVWFDWCSTCDADPLQPRPLDVRDFLRSHSPHRSPRSVRQMMSAISIFTCRIMGNPNPTTVEIVKGEMRRQFKANLVPPRQVEALRLKGDVIEMEDEALPFSIDRMIESFGHEQNVQASRAHLLLSLGCDTGRRGAEYRAANMRHIVLRRDGTGILVITQSKTDQAGHGSKHYISRRTVRFFQEWRAVLEADGRDIGPDTPLLRSIYWYGSAGRILTPSGFTYILREIVRKALLTIGDPATLANLDNLLPTITGHSFRVGLAQDLTAAGETIQAICVAGGWRCPSMPIWYARNISPGSGAVAKLRRRLGDGEDRADDGS